MKEKRYSMPQGKKITKDQMQEGTDYYDGFYDLANIVEKNWSVKKIKEFLRDLIDSKLIYQIKIGDQVVLERIMLGNKVRKIDSKKWKKFFKNLQPAALTESGIKELTEFANSNSSVQNPPDISQYGEIEVVDEEVTTSEETSEEIGDATSEQIQESTKNKLLFEEYNLDTPENILSNTRIEKSRVISIDKELTELKTMETNSMILFFVHSKKNIKMLSI